jgi:glycogen phosphorylase
VDQVPIGHVTNGVHIPTWDSSAANDLWTAACGKDCWHGATETMEQDIRCLSDASLWQFRSAASVVLVEYARERLSKELAVSGASPEAVNCAKHLFDPKYLTLGFARRYHCRNPQLLATSPAAISMQ